MTKINKSLDEIKSSPNLSFTISGTDTHVEKNKGGISLILNGAKVEIDELPKDISEDYINSKINEYTGLLESLKALNEELQSKTHKLPGYETEMDWLLRFYKELGKKIITNIVKNVTKVNLILSGKGTNTDNKVNEEYVKIYNYTILRRIRKEIVRFKMDIQNNCKHNNAAELVKILNHCIAILFSIEEIKKIHLISEGNSDFALEN